MLVSGDTGTMKEPPATTAGTIMAGQAGRRIVDRAIGADANAQDGCFCDGRVLGESARQLRAGGCRGPSVSCDLRGCSSTATCPLGPACCAGRPAAQRRSQGRACYRKFFSRCARRGYSRERESRGFRNQRGTRSGLRRGVLGDCAFRWNIVWSTDEACSGGCNEPRSRCLLQIGAQHPLREHRWDH